MAIRVSQWKTEKLYGHTITKCQIGPGWNISGPDGTILRPLHHETREEARALARSRDLWRVRFEAGEFKPMPSIEEAAAYEFSEAELASIDRTSAHRVQGTPNEVYDQLMRLAKRFAVEEIVVLSVTPTYLQRMRCYELLADAFDLTSLGEASDEAPREEVTL